MTYTVRLGVAVDAVIAWMTIAEVVHVVVRIDVLAESVLNAPETFLGAEAESHRFDQEVDLILEKGNHHHVLNAAIIIINQRVDLDHHVKDPIQGKEGLFF